jgi:hypothetical protein
MKARAWQRLHANKMYDAAELECQIETSGQEVERRLMTHYRPAASPTHLDIVAAVGLAIGGLFGLAGTFAEQAALRQSFWAFDGVALVVATTLMAIRFLRSGDDCVAAGFLVFAMGESLLVSGTAAGMEGSVPSFGGGVALWAAGLLLISVPATLAIWVRVAGVAAALSFAVVAGRIFWGEVLLPTAAPMPFFAYPVLVLTFVGWIATLLKRA